MIIYKSFISFMEDCVLPHHRERSNDIRLDGEQTGGKRKAFGYFSYNGRDWKVDEDTHYKPLELAYDAFKTGKDPFVDNATTTGKARCLVLVPEIRELQRSRAKHMYIYQA